MRTAKATQSWWRKLKVPQKVVYATLLALFVGLAGFLSFNDATASKNVDVMPNIQGQPTLGNAGPLLILIEDFHCEHCKHFTETVFPELEARARRGELQIVYINPARGGSRQRTAAAAECVYRENPGEFWHYKKGLYFFQRLGKVEKHYLFDLTRVPRETLKHCLDTYGREQATLDYEAAKNAGVQATPSVIVGDSILANPSREQLDRKLERIAEAGSGS